MRTLTWALTFLVLGMLGCGPVYSTVRPSAGEVTSLRRVALVLPQEGSFTVIDERAKATVAPAAMFGIVGAVVASAANQSMDSSSAAALAPNVAGFAPRGILRDSFVATLSAGRSTEVQVVDKEPARAEANRYDAVLTLRIAEWGLRVPAHGVSDKLAAFVDLEATMTRMPDGQVLWQEHDVALGQRRDDLARYRADGDLLRSELKETLESAGYRMANLLLYPSEARK